MSRIDSLDPNFRPVVDAVMREASLATGLAWVCVSGRRSMAEQGKLFDQGRTTPGPIVTNARPGSSAHNFGLAADLAPMKDGRVWWDAPDSVWQTMADIARSHGLTAGYYFKSIKDFPHIEHPSWRNAQARWRAGALVVV